MKYVQYINSLIKDHVANKSDIVLFGQNINAGSSLSGLTRGLLVHDNSLIINTQNSENTLVGVGFGLMLNSVSSVFFMKQMDFLLLGIDHLVNTYNIIRQTTPTASFTILPVIVDSGYEGAQSSFNSFDDICSIAKVEGFSFTNSIDTEKIISMYLVTPGFRVIGVSQRLMKEEVIKSPVLYQDDRYRFFKYRAGKDVTIVCFNYSLTYGIEINKILEKNGVEATLFSINAHFEFDYQKIVEDLMITRNLILIDQL